MKTSMDAAHFTPDLGTSGTSLFSQPSSAVAPIAKARRVLNAFEERKPTNASLAYVRGKLVELYNERVRTRPPEMHYCTGDDAARLLEEWSEFPRGGCQNWKGAVFRTKEWERIPGDVPSLRPSHNGTPLARWRPRS